jgi:multiple sugar transport system ATP-binding protein
LKQSIQQSLTVMPCKTSSLDKQSRYWLLVIDMGAVKLENIVKQFDETTVIRQLNLQIKDGEFLTLVGPSGCGKSTLLRIIAGLEQQTEGHIFLDEKEVDRIRPSQRDLAMVFQSYALYPHLTVFENIAVPLKIRNLSSWQRLPFAHWFVPKTREQFAKIQAEVIEVAKTLGLDQLLHRKPGQLSGGQRQRVALGRAIVRHPQAFLFDEPLSNLDAKLRVHMRSEITRLHQQLKTTFIYVTHDQAEAMTMSDRIAVMMDGELIQIGSPEEVYRNPQDIRVAEFIGSPKINCFTCPINSQGSIELFGEATTLSLNVDFNQQCQLAVRPENILLFQNKREDSINFQARIDIVENMGAEVFIHVSPCLPQMQLDEKVIVRLNASEMNSDIQNGKIIALHFKKHKALVFNSEGKRIDVTNKIPEVVNA